jgi:PAS domain S-box-containing protein
METKKKTSSLNIKDISETIFEAANEGMLVTDKDGIIQLINPRLEEMFGYAYNELMGEKVEILVPDIYKKGYTIEEEKNENPNQIKRNLSIGIDLLGRKKDGIIFPVEIGINGINKGSEHFIIIMITDISKRIKISKSLQEEKEKIELYLDIAPSIFLVINENHIVQMINRRGCEILGFKKEEIIGKDWFKSFIPVDEQKRISKTYSRIIKEEIHLDAYFECEVISKNGKKRLIGWNNEALLDKNGIITGTLSVGKDITEHKRATYSLQKETEKAQQYLDLSGAIFVALDKQGKITMINKSGCKIFGYECLSTKGKCLIHDGGTCQMEGRNWFDEFVPEKKRNEVKGVFLKLMKGEVEPVEYYENKLLCKNGSHRVISWHNNVLKNSEGEIIGTLSSGMDITRQKNAEEKLIKLNAELEQKVKERTLVLEESQQMYSMIARNFPNGEINVFDKDLNYVFVEGMELYKKGITGDMLIGTSFLKRIDSEIRDDLEKKLLAVFKGKNTNFELETEKKIYMINAVGLHDVDNKINQILMVSQNITSLKKAEKDIQRSLEKEQHLNELKSRFVSMASHEFRTPLTTAMNSTALLSRYIGTSGSEEKQLKNINRIKTSIHHLTNILNDFLSLDKLEQGKIEVVCSEFNFPEFAHEIVEEMEGVIKKEQQIKTEHKGEDIVFVDKQMLKNILNNLISNAIKYSPENSTIKVETQVKGENLKIIVADDGIGIPKEEQSHLFERFFRAKNAINIQGTGLGLNIIKNYVEMVNGKISFISEVDKGSTFTIEIPICRELCKDCDCQ